MKFLVRFLLLGALCLCVFSVENSTRSADTTETTTYELNTSTNDTTADTTEASADTSTEPITQTTTVTTPAKCSDGESVNDNNCDCDGGKAVTPYGGYCAEPCDSKFVWCEPSRECQANSSSFECVCAIGYYEEGDSCEPGKFFGGEITFENTFEKDMKSQIETDIKNILEYIYGNSTGFQSAEVLNSRSGSIVASYKLIYNTRATKSVVMEAFDNFTTSNCLNGSANVSNFEPDLNLTLNFIVNCTESAETVIDDAVLCGYDPYNVTCDTDSSTCTNSNGAIWCECKKDYERIDGSATTCQFVDCTSNDECNDPFGDCDKSADPPICVCMWGFSGANCKDPWLFTFTIVTCGLGLILIILVIVLICKSQKMKSNKNKMAEDLNLKNPFVDFQPGLVRAKMPSSMNQAYDSLDLKEGVNGNTKRNSYSNGAYNHGLDDPYQRNPTTFRNDHQSANVHNPGRANDTDYF